MLSRQKQKMATYNSTKFPEHSKRGFLPFPDPLTYLPPAFTPWEKAAQDMPKLLVANKLRSAIEQMPVLDIKKLKKERQYDRAMLLLSFMGHGYVWGGGEPTNCIPKSLALPWYEVAKKLGRPPVLSYASYALTNWRRIHSKEPIRLGNIVMLQNFFGGLDEEWFVLVHIDIEAKAVPAVAAIHPAQEAVLQNQPHQLEARLLAMASALDQMYATLLRMPEHCDPYIYYHRVRPYLYGWKNQPSLPHGLVYEGVKAYDGKPQKFRGETGAQSSIIPSLDAALGIGHQQDMLHAYLMEMREYMPPRDKAFLEAIERGPSIRQYVLDHHQNHPSLREAYNRCVHGIELFRSKHLEYASTYIQQQSQRHSANPTDIGTGGTPFMPYLGKHLEETTKHQIH